LQFYAKITLLYGSLRSLHLLTSPGV